MHETEELKQQITGASVRAAVCRTLVNPKFECTTRSGAYRAFASDLRTASLPNALFRGRVLRTMLRTFYFPKCACVLPPYPFSVLCGWTTSGLST